MRARPPALVLALLGACASSPAQRPDEPLIEDTSSSRAGASRPVLVAPGTIRREELRRVLGGSPGAFLAHVDVLPVFQGKSFLGWRVRSFFPGDARLAGVLRAGDVVVRVNEHAVERPEQFIEVWQAAAGRGDLTLDIVRDARPQRLAWRIVD